MSSGSATRRCQRLTASLGVLSLGRLTPTPFTQDEMERVTQVAAQIAIALENATAFDEIAALKERLARENVYLQEEIRGTHQFEEIVGESKALQRVLDEVRTVAATDTTVLLLGETGTGKELLARALHAASDRRSRALVTVNCTTSPAGLLESEWFGHEKGAFTGALSQKVGRFELAHQGTLFLDEIGDVPLELQSKLLRVLQEHEIERLGSTRTIRVDFRLIAATNRNLEEMVGKREFRSDLYYRLNVFPIRIPPLRERREDIPPLVFYFAQRFAKRLRRSIESVSRESLDVLCRWPWPGNIRELQNVIERAVILSRGPVLTVSRAEFEDDGADDVGAGDARGRRTRAHPAGARRHELGDRRPARRRRAARRQADVARLDDAPPAHRETGAGSPDVKAAGARRSVTTRQRAAKRDRHRQAGQPAGEQRTACCLTSPPAAPGRPDDRI